MSGHQVPMRQTSFWQRHSLGLVALGILLLWCVLYLNTDSHSHLGSFAGNAISDWIGVTITIYATKWFFEKGSRESRKPRPLYKNRMHEFFHEHSLTLFLLATGLGWVWVFLEMDPEGRWGTVVSNIVSEWSQQIGLVVLTKRLVESHSKESSDE